MTRQEFARGWMLLIAQPWGRRYEGDSEIAQAQREFYYNTFRDVSGEKWFWACCSLAAKADWPGVGIINRIVNPSQHPGPEAAWAIVAPKVGSDTPTIFVTEEMREAFGSAIALDDNLIAARMAFKEAYTQLVDRADSLGAQPKWSMMPGTDPRSKELAIQEALKKKQIPIEWAMKQLPVEAHESLLALAGDTQKRIA